MLVVAAPQPAENSSGKLTAAPDIILALGDLILEIRENNKFLKYATKKEFSFLKPKRYESDNHY
jgi:hypothetical protein